MKLKSFSLKCFEIYNLWYNCKLRSYVIYLIKLLRLIYGRIGYFLFMNLIVNFIVSSFLNKFQEEYKDDNRNLK